MAHTTWGSYETMLRIMKHYKLPNLPGAASSGVIFAGYPGLIVSNDDFYFTGNTVN